MTFTYGLFVRPDDNKGTTPAEARLAMEGLITQPGVLKGLVVSGTPTWTYRVNAGSYVVAHPGGSGYIVGANDGTVDVPTAPAPATGSRIDVIYVMHHDVEQGDPDSAPVVSVAQGAVSGTPAAPALPDGALELARHRVDAGDTGTQNSRGVTRGQVRPAGVNGAYQWRAGTGMPYAMAAGVVNTDSVPAQSNGDVIADVEFPPGRFTVTPVITVQANAVNSLVRFNCGIQGTSPTGFRVVLENATGAARPAVVMWQAVQMTPDSREG